jgi:hypothetical protein
MFDQCLYFNTTALARVLEREWTVAFKPFGLTPAQAFMLRVILEKPGSLQSEVAREMTITRSTATRTLDGLQKSLREQINSASGEVTKRLKKSLSVPRFDEAVAKVVAVRKSLE